jgi:hypothetical protein
MKQTPFEQTINELFTKLDAAVKQRQEADVYITSNTAAIKALAATCEDEEKKAEYLAMLDEVSGKPGFKQAVLSVLRTHPKGLTPKEIRSWIMLTKKMELSGYSNPLASIHTTLRRMVDSEEVEGFENEKKEKAYRLKGLPRLDAPTERKRHRFI